MEGARVDVRVVPLRRCACLILLIVNAILGYVAIKEHMHGQEMERQLSTEWERTDAAKAKIAFMQDRLDQSRTDELLGQFSKSVPGREPGRNDSKKTEKSVPSKEVPIRDGTRSSTVLSMKNSVVGNDGSVLLRATPPLMSAYSLVLHIFCSNRLDTFRRMWTSIENAMPVDAASLRIVIHVNRDSNNEGQLIRAVSKLSSKHGPVNLNVGQRNADSQGLKARVLSAWQPQSNAHEFAMFLEDDVEVSVFFLQYCEAMIAAYFQPPVDTTLFGFSLYNKQVDDMTFRPMARNLSQPYLWQTPQAWGGVYYGPTWRAFLAWYNKDRNNKMDPVLPMAVGSNLWRRDSSWAKYAYRFMAQTGRLMFFPDLPGAKSYVVNHGTHISSQDDRVTLVTFIDAHRIDIFNTPSLSRLHIYDAWQRPIKRPEALRSDVTRWDSCNVVIALGDDGAPPDAKRAALAGQLVDHYAKMSVSDTVVLVWEGKGRPPNLTMTASIDVQSVKVVVANSQSTKYMLPPATLGTHECMLHVEGWKPMEELMLDGLHEVWWKEDFFKMLIGVQSRARSHARAPAEVYPAQPNAGSAGFYAVCDDTVRREASLVMAGPMIYHVHYQRRFAKLNQQLRNEVDEIKGCSVVLLNAVIAHARSAAPVVLDDDMFMHGDPAKRRQRALPLPLAFGNLEQCLEKLAAWYKTLPLKYAAPIHVDPFATRVRMAQHVSSSESKERGVVCTSDL